MLRDLPVLDITRMGEQELKEAEAMYANLNLSKLKSFAKIDEDEIRHEIDASLFKILWAANENKKILEEIATIRSLMAQDPAIITRA